MAGKITDSLPKLPASNLNNVTLCDLDENYLKNILQVKELGPMEHSHCQKQSNGKLY